MVGSRLALVAGLLLGATAVRLAAEQPRAALASLPPGLPAPQVPADNTLNVAKVELGTRLFFDPRLSLTGTFSCASCHDPARAFTDGLPRARGATGERHPRNTPTLVNAAYGASLGWLDMGVRGLEAQHRIPLFNEAPIELGFGPVADRRLAEFRADARLRRLIAQAFDGLAADDFALEHVVRALASYVRTLVFANSAFDRYVYWGEASLTADAQSGLRLFLSPRVGCVRCHAGFNLSGPVAHAQNPDAVPVFHGGVRAPTLRNVAVTAPYFHDGSLATLEDVLAFYDRKGHDRPIPLGAEEQRGLLAFLNSLTDACWATPPLRPPSTRSRPRAPAGCPGPP